jgi:hypothetical protein
MIMCTPQRFDLKEVSSRVNQEVNVLNRKAAKDNETVTGYQHELQ